MGKNIELKGVLRTASGNSQEIEISGDDAVVIVSNITGAVLGAAANGDPSYTREVDIWAGGFCTKGDLFSRLAEATVQVFSDGGGKSVEHNLVNFIMFIINNSSLKGKVSLHVKEDLIETGRKGGLDNNGKNEK